MIERTAAYLAYYATGALLAKQIDDREYASRQPRRAETPIGEMRCAQCGRGFHAYRSTRRFCSDSCRVTACRKRART